VLEAGAANNLAGDLLKTARPEWARLRKFVRYSRGRQDLPWLPEGVDSEYRDIAVKSATNWIDLVIRSATEGLIVDGYGDGPDSDLWSSAWQDNGMDARQHALHRAAGTLGYAYLPVLPAEEAGRVWMRPVAATAMFAQFEDEADEFPQYAIREVTAAGRGKPGRWELYDDEARYLLTGKLGSAQVEVLEHGLEVCPVTAMRWSIDLLGHPMGEVEPVISVQDRIVDATFTLQMVAKYGAFPQRWIAGINPGEPLRDADGNPLLDSDGNPIMPTIKAYIDHIIMGSDPDTKFGQFAAADLRQYVDALEAHIRHLAAITQTPPHYLLGSLVNLSAEALAAAESGLQRKIREKREVLGEGYEQALRLAAQVLGDEEAANDTSSQVHWQDVESRSLAQTADALLKLGQLGVPPKMLFQMIPGWTQDDAEAAAAELAASNPTGQLAEALLAAQTSPTLPAA
jgi:HPt (histidine-containing phosphotransfer) domain-containing protein